MSYQFSEKNIREVARGLDQAGVPVIECSHGDGLAGSSIQFGVSREPEERLIAAAAEEIKNGRLAILLLPGVGTQKNLGRGKELGAKIARVATHCTEADISEQHIKMAKDIGLDVHTFLMMAHMNAPDRLADQAKLMESYGADCIYVVDSAGTLLIDETRQPVRAVRGALQPGTERGFHAPNKPGLAGGKLLAPHPQRSARNRR